MSKMAVTKGTGNVFTDIGLPNAGAHLAKADLVIKIADAINRKRLTQAGAAERMGLSQPDVSRLLKGHFDRFSLERLLLILTKLGQNVSIEVSEPKRPRKTGTLKVEAA